MSMSACGCGACLCILPMVCLHFSLFTVGSLVCESQLPSLLIRASPLNMSACYNACRVVIFYPKMPLGFWVVRDFSNAFTARGMQAISLCDRGRNREEEEGECANRKRGQRQLQLIESLHHYAVADRGAYAHGWLV